VRVRVGVGVGVGVRVRVRVSVGLHLGQDVIDKITVVNAAVHTLRGVPSVGGGDEINACVIVIGSLATHGLPLRDDD